MRYLTCTTAWVQPPSSTGEPHRGVIATSRPQENLVPTLGYHALFNQQKLWTETFFLLTTGTLYGLGSVWRGFPCPYPVQAMTPHQINTGIIVNEKKTIAKISGTTKSTRRDVASEAIPVISSRCFFAALNAPAPIGDSPPHSKP